MGQVARDIVKKLHLQCLKYDDRNRRLRRSAGVLMCVARSSDHRNLV